MNEIDPTSLNGFLSRKTGLKFPLGDDILEDTSLSESQIKDIMLDFGNYLGDLHLIEGEGFGQIDADGLGKGKLVGTHSSWYKFLLENFKNRFQQMKLVLRQEHQNGKYITKLSESNRKLMGELISRSKDVEEIIESQKDFIESSPSRFLNGNLYLGNIIVRDRKFVGLGDFHQPLLGDPVDDLAYFSIMPQGEKYLPFVLKGWQEKIKEPDFDKKLHLYRLIESYRKIVKRYIKYQYLQKYPEPLIIARDELAYYNKG